MSYILTGPGLGLGPCLGSLQRCSHSPLVCLACSRYLSRSGRGTLSNRFRTVPLRSIQASNSSPFNPNLYQHSFNASSLSSNIPTLSDEQINNSVESTSQYQALYESAKKSDSFTHFAQTNFLTSPSPSNLSLSPNNPLSVNLSFHVGPDVVSGVSYRFLHTSSALEKKSSRKVEDTVLRLKEKQNETLAELSQSEDLEKTIKTVIEKDEEDTAVKKSIENQKKPDNRTVWEKVVAEAKHYYSGFKLLFLDVKVSSKIIWKVLNGKTLSRRENRQLVRTVSDLFRLVPFSVFIIVPFMELLLPIALKLFPGMLPSTFTSQDERENKMRRALKAKLEYARFLQKTLDEMAPLDKDHHSRTASDFVSFYDSIKQKGGAVDSGVSNEQILKFSKVFEDSITLDNMTRGQLVAICRLLDLTPIGTNAFLRFQIEMQLRKLRADDVIIAKEGVENMTVGELQNACKDRGMRALGMTREKLVQQLKQWIELSTNEKVPPSLLLLSRTLYLPESLAPEKAIEASISALPEAAATKAKAKIGEREGKIENVTRLEVIKQEQKKIEEEQEEQEKQRLEKEKKQAEEKVKAEKLAQEALEAAKQETVLGVPPLSPPTVERVVLEGVSVLRRATVSQEGELQAQSGPSISPTEILQGDDIHVGTADVMQESAPTKRVSKAGITEEMSSADLAALKAAIETITTEKGKAFISDHQVLGELKQELAEYVEDLGEMEEVAELAGRKDLRQGKGAARLFKKVNNMLGKLDGVVTKLESRQEKLSEVITSLEGQGESAEAQESHLVTVQDLLGAVRRMQELPDSNMLERIGEVIATMDEDSDGVVKVEHVNKVIEILGRENVELSGKQIKQIIDLIGKEEMIEVESRIEKILGKMPIIKQMKTKELEVADTSKDLSLDSQQNVLVDKAEEIGEEKVEEHIAELFSRPSAEIAEKKSSSPLMVDMKEESGQILSRPLPDSSSQDVSEPLKEEQEEEPKKMPHSNGSK